MSEETLRKDLKEIRYYYSNKKQFDTLFADIRNDPFLEKLEKYNSIMRVAGLQLYDTYTSIYVLGETQKAMAQDKCLTLGYVKELHRKLIRFLLENM